MLNSDTVFGIDLPFGSYMDVIENEYRPEVVLFLFPEQYKKISSLLFRLPVVVPEVDGRYTRQAYHCEICALNGRYGQPHEIYVVHELLWGSQPISNQI